MTLDSNDRYQLLLLIHDLLDEPEAAELRRRIETDQTWAAAYESAKETASLISRAATIQPPAAADLQPPAAGREMGRSLFDTRISLQSTGKKAMQGEDQSTPRATRGPSGEGAASRRREKTSTGSAKKPSPQPDRSVRSPFTRPTIVVVSAASVLLLFVSLVVYFYHRGELSAIAAKHMRVVVTGPSEVEAGRPAVFKITTGTITGSPIPAKVKLTLSSRQGDAQPLVHNRETDDQGKLDFVIPAERLAQAGPCRLEVETMHEGEELAIASRLTIRSPRYTTRLTIDRPLLRADRADEKIRFRGVTLTQFGLAASESIPIHFEILDPSGATVAGSARDETTVHGVAAGEFTVPVGLAGGRYELIARSPTGLFPEQRRHFFLRQYRLPQLKKEIELLQDSYAPGDTVDADISIARAEGTPAAGATLKVRAMVDGAQIFPDPASGARDFVITLSKEGGALVSLTLPEKIETGRGVLVATVDDGSVTETITEPIPINLGKVDIAFYPEGGRLAMGVHNRIYFTALDSLGEPVSLRGVIVDEQGTDLLPVETTHKGMGRFDAFPRVGKKYLLRIDEPAGVSKPVPLPRADANQRIALLTGSGVFGAGEPLEVAVCANVAGIPLVIEAVCREIPVGRATLVTRHKPGSPIGTENPVTIPLDERAGGVIRLTVFDYSTSPPVPLAERLVYRGMDRRLDVKATASREAYSPGQAVGVTLDVTDKQGKPVPGAILGATVVNDTLLNLAEDDTPGLDTDVLLLSQVDRPEDLEEADFYLSGKEGAEVALDLLLGTRGYRELVEKTSEEMIEEGIAEDCVVRLAAVGLATPPPILFDNLSIIKSRYETSLGEYNLRRTDGMKMLTTLTVFAALGLLIGAILLMLLKMSQGAPVWAPALAATVGCVLIGWVVSSPNRGALDADRSVAFAPHGIAVEDAESWSNESTRREGGEGLDEIEELQRIEALDVTDDMEPPPIDMVFEDVGLKQADAKVLQDKGGVEAGQQMGERNPPADPAVMDDLVAQDIADEDRLRERFEENARWDGRNLKEDVLGRFAEAGKRMEKLFVREYAHAYTGGDDDVRRDFTEVLYWHPLLITDENGQAKISFDLCDTITAFKLMVEAHADVTVQTPETIAGGSDRSSNVTAGKDAVSVTTSSQLGRIGRIGSGATMIVSRIPFRIEPILPLEVTSGDRILLPVAVINDSEDALDVNVALQIDEMLELAPSTDDLASQPQPSEKTQSLAAGARGRMHFPLDVVGEAGESLITVRGTAGRLKDSIEKPLRIVPPGYPRSESFSGQVSGTQQLSVNLPENIVPGSLEVTVTVLPSTLAELQKGMEGLLREPCGCFEQASTSNYPNALSLKYMKEHDVASPDIERKAKRLLTDGYKKLTGYESPEKGYEWFGGNPGHEALTAYGLLEFRDMAEVHDVDPEMLQRTADWLLARRDGKGGFQRNSRALDSFGQASEDVTNAYITWALAESGQEGIEKEVEHVLTLAESSDDPYVIALAAAAGLSTGETDRATALLEKLRGLQDDDGRLVGTEGSITRSGGESLAVETTALAALAWLKSPKFIDSANKAIEWIIQQRGGGTFGSTQATILALKALIEHSKANKRPITGGTLIVRRDNLEIGSHEFQAGAQEAIVVDGIEAKLQTGANTLEIELTGENEMPFTLDVRYRVDQPDSSPRCPVGLRVELATDQVAAGETVTLSATLENLTDQGQPMTVASIGLPGGLEVETSQLEDLRESGKIDYYETRGREIVFYWRSLAPRARRDLKLQAIAAIPGRYTGPASHTYLYYTAEEKQWRAPLVVTIEPKQ